MIPDYNHKTKIINSKEYIFDEIRKKWILTTPEEIVRQNCWKFLHFEKNYPRGLITIEKELKIKFLSKSLIVTFHPVTLENASSKKYIFELMKSLEDLEDTTLVITHPNADIDNHQISNGELITLQLNEGVIYTGHIEDDNTIDKYKYV